MGLTYRVAVLSALLLLQGCIGEEPKALPTPPEDGAAGTTPYVGGSTPRSAGAGGSTPAVTPPVVPASAGGAGPSLMSCQSSIPNAECDPLKKCGCTEGEACYVSDVDGAKAVVECTSPGRLSPGTLCKGLTECTPGYSCIGPEDGAVCRALCASDKDCGNGVCDSVTAKSNGSSVAVEGFRVCFNTCSSNSECATGCCARSASGVNVCAAASACCQSDSECGSGGCCIKGSDGVGMCGTGTQCGTKTGGVCEEHGDCLGYAEGTSLCVSDDTSASRCAATCTSNSQCKSNCCATTTKGNGVCGPPEYCEEPPTNSCKDTGEVCTSATDCCGYAANTGTCVNLGSVAGCGVYCTSGSQCKSGCCAPLKSGKSVCAAETYCQ